MSLDIPRSVLLAILAFQNPIITDKRRIFGVGGLEPAYY